MEAVVAIQNNMNENTWREVLKWEELHKSSCDAPKLLRFMGRPHELTNKAALKYYTGLAPRPSLQTPRIDQVAEQAKAINARQSEAVAETVQRQSDPKLVAKRWR